MKVALGFTRAISPSLPRSGSSRLFDLVKIKDEALRPAFFFAMGNTLVASDLDQALRIAYGKDAKFKRVVTLQVRHPSRNIVPSG